MITFVFIVAYTWQQSHDRNRTLVRYYVLQSRTNVWYLTNSYPQLRTTSSKVIHKLSTRMITYITHVKVRQPLINVAMKRFADDIRTIRMQTVSNVRKSYPQVIHRLVNATQSYPQLIHKLSVAYC